MEKPPSRENVHNQIIDRAAELLVRRMEQRGQGPLGATPHSPVGGEHSDAGAGPDLIEERPAVAHAQPQRMVIPERTAGRTTPHESMLLPGATPPRQSSGYRMPVRPQQTHPNRSIWREHPARIIALALAGVTAV